MEQIWPRRNLLSLGGIYTHRCWKLLATGVWKIKSCWRTKFNLWLLVKLTLGWKRSARADTVIVLGILPKK